MFGLMKARVDENNKLDYESYRLSYCGTCKAIGVLYSSESRFFLNRDVVFLSEILTEISEFSQKKCSWDKSFYSINCFDMPFTANISNSLSYCASVNMLLASMKIQDDIFDERGLTSQFWNSINYFFEKDFEKAKIELKTINFPLNIIESHFCEHNKREKMLSTKLDYYSRETANITGLVFAHGMKTVQQNELSELGFQIGYDFGKLVYIVDAAKDLRKDIVSNNFNPFKVIYKITDKKLPHNVLMKIKYELNTTRISLNKKLALLPIQQDKISEFQERLNINIDELITQLGVKNDQTIFQKLCESLIIKNLKKFYNRSAPKIALLVGLILYILLPKSIYFNSKIVNRVFLSVSKKRSS